MTGGLVADPLSLAGIEEMIAAEEAADDETLHLTANETVLSPFAQSVLSSVLANRYLLEHLDMRENSPSRLGNFLYRGLDRINEIERSATEICRRLFSAEYAEFRCVSGLHAMQTTIAALTEAGDTVMRVSTKDGGHFLTELMCRSFGRHTCTYSFDDKGELDIEATAAVIDRRRPSLLYIDAMNYLFPFPLRPLREVAQGAPIVYDASHTLGLIAGGQFQDPLSEGADILQANTHKTFFGPQKGIILGSDRALMERISYVLSNGMVSSQHTASTLALFVALHECYAYGREYAVRVVENARHLAMALAAESVPIVASDRGCTRNHVLYVDTRPLESGPVLLDRLLSAGISVNRVIAFEHIDALRLGVQEVTRRGYGPAEMEEIAGLLAGLLRGACSPEQVKPAVRALVKGHPRILYCDEERQASSESRRKRAKRSSSQDAPGGRSSQGAIGAETRGRPRWVNTALKRLSIVPDMPDEFSTAHRLGVLAGRYEHQTDSAGNISFSADGRLYVSVSGAYIKDLAAHDFVEVGGCRDWCIDCRGNAQPSAEVFMHYRLSQAVDARYVVHNHYIPRDRMDGVYDIPPEEYGSVELAEAVAEAALNSPIIYVRRHGLVFWARSAGECRELLDYCWSPNDESVGNGVAPGNEHSHHLASSAGIKRN